MGNNYPSVREGTVGQFQTVIGTLSGTRSGTHVGRLAGWPSRQPSGFRQEGVKVDPGTRSSFAKGAVFGVLWGAPGGV